MQMGLNKRVTTESKVQIAETSNRRSQGVEEVSSEQNDENEDEGPVTKKAKTSDS
jgi:hypothetical protein